MAEAYIRHTLDVVLEVACVLEEGIRALEEGHVPDAAFLVLEEDTEDVVVPRQEGNSLELVLLQNHNTMHSRLLWEEPALEALLRNIAAEVALEVEVRHIDYLAHRKGHHEAAVHKEEAVREHPGSRDMAVAYAIEVVEANGRHEKVVHDLTIVAAGGEDIPDFRGKHCSWDCRVPRRNWSSQPYWH